MFVEDVEKVCDVVNYFFETRQKSIDKDLHLSKNKILRNTELYQFAAYIKNNNKKGCLDIESFLQAAFVE